MLSTFWKILLVDDDEDDYYLTREMLATARYDRFSLEWAPTFDLGQRKLRTDAYDAVLVDYDLGLRSGLDLIREAVAEQCQAPLILYTGRGSFEVDMEAMEAGATLYLSKSEATPLLLERIIRYAIERKQTEEDLRRARDELEQRVVERTRELGELNTMLTAEIAERKEKEQALKDSETLLRQVLENLPVGVWITDGQGTIIHGNPAAQRIWAGAKYVGIEEYGTYKAWWADTGEPVAPGEWAAVRAIRQGETAINETIEIECFDGTHKIIYNSAVPLHTGDQKVTGVIVVNQDITKQKQAEAALWKTSELLEKVFSNIHIAIAYLDTEFNFIRVNDNYAKADEREPAFFVGKNHFDLFPNTENEAIFRRVVETGESYFVYSRPFAYQEHPERGVTYWDWSLQTVKEPDRKVIGVVLSLINVSERVEAEKQLKENNQLLEELFESTPHAILLIDMDGSILRANRQTEVLFGFSPEALAGKQIEILLPERFQACHVERRHDFARHPTTRPMGSGLEILARKQTGEEFPAEVMVSPLHLNGSVFTICAIREK